MITSEKIINYISKNSQATGKELTDYLGISDRGTRKQLKRLTEKNILQKIGKPPKVYYLLASERKSREVIRLNKNALKIINKRYLYITPTGEAKEGWDGFLAWCEKTKQNPIKTSTQYIAALKKFDKFRKNNLINGMPKMKNTFKNVYLDKLFYLDFYSIERFGKTKLGQTLLYAKQSQNRHLIRKLIDQIRLDILKVIKKEHVNGVLFVPPTVKREIQFMKELEKQLRLPVRNLSVAKIKTEIMVPQKTLSRLEDRIENAKKTIIVEEKSEYENILLIDDAVGSGATMNETGKQIKNRRLAKRNIVGLAITGSFKVVL